MSFNRRLDSLRELITSLDTKIVTVLYTPCDCDCQEVAHLLGMLETWCVVKDNAVGPWTQLVVVMDKLSQDRAEMLKREVKCNFLTVRWDTL